MNLIDNAVQAAAPQGEVWVRGEAKDPLLIRVEDTGPGVDPAVRARLFEPLVTTRVKGIGLGLALVKRIADGAVGVAVGGPNDIEAAKAALAAARSA